MGRCKSLGMYCIAPPPQKKPVSRTCWDSYSAYACVRVHVWACLHSAGTAPNSKVAFP